MLGGSSIEAYATGSKVSSVKKVFALALTGSLWICIPRPSARLRILGRSFFLGVFSDEHAMTKCVRFPYGACCVNLLLVKYDSVCLEDV